jgi:hypothetical protein
VSELRWAAILNRRTGGGAVMLEMTTKHSILLEEIRFAMSHRIPEELFKEGISGGIHAIKLERDIFTRDYILQIHSKFWSKTRDIELAPAPTTWWDHFKRDAIPTFTRWLRLTIHFRHDVIHAATIFPDVPQIQGGRYYYAEVAPSMKYDVADQTDL